jgi:hypothetical protein
VRMYVADDVGVSASSSFSDTSIFGPDDPSDIVESLEASFRVKPPRAAYQRVRSVANLIQVFQAHVQSRN